MFKYLVVFLVVFGFVEVTQAQVVRARVRGPAVRVGGFGGVGRGIGFVPGFGVARGYGIGFGFRQRAFFAPNYGFYAQPTVAVYQQPIIQQVPLFQQQQFVPQQFVPQQQLYVPRQQFVPRQLTPCEQQQFQAPLQAPLYGSGCNRAGRGY